MQPLKKAKEDPKPKAVAKKAEPKPVKKEVKKEEPASASKGTTGAVAVKREKKVFELPGTESDRYGQRQVWTVTVMDRD